MNTSVSSVPLEKPPVLKKSCSSIGGGDHICNFFKYLLIHLKTFILGNKMVNFNFLHSLTFINANANANNFLFFLLVFLWLPWRHKHGLCVLSWNLKSGKTFDWDSCDRMIPPFVNQKLLKNGLISSKGIVMLFGSLANGLELVQGTCVSCRNSQKFELNGLLWKQKLNSHS